MTTAAEIKRWTRPLAARRDDIVLRGRSLWLLPINHMPVRVWSAQKTKHWQVEDLWQPTPFPIELGASD